MDADQFAREALQPGRHATNTVLRRYGAKVQANGAVSTELPWAKSFSTTKQNASGSSN